MKSILTLCMVQVSFSYAGEFYTIIGPDGRPMVIQQKALAKTNVVKAEPVITAVQEQQREAQPLKRNAVQVVKSEQTLTVIKEQQPENQPAKIIPEVKESTSSELKVDLVSSGQVVPKTDMEAMGQKQVPIMVPVEPKVEKTEKKVLKPPLKNEKQEQQVTYKSAPVKPQVTENTDAFATIDGEKYIKNEYLEDKEFNLEGKKRFYAMPEGIIDTKHGATRLQLVEREKGLSKSLLNSFLKKKQPQDSGPIILSSTYYRVSQADAVNSLGQQCIQDKKIKDAKTVSLNKDINIWPRAPLKEQFDFEIVKLSSAIRNIQINSYASRQENPTFYWPFVVFLDAKGCVLEGAGGFKNHEASSSFISHEKIEGIVHIPSNSQYILLTPLASAIDLDNRALTNQGQLKLIAIR